LLALWALIAAGLPARADEPHAFAVATADPLATAAAEEILRAGGNAADAAVAAALVLGVVNPWNSGIGGGGFALVHRASDRATTFLDFRETAPAAATADMFVREGRAVPELSRRGGLAVGVPGEVAGLAEISRRFGKLGLAKAAAAAIRIAERGYPAGPEIAEVFRGGPPADGGLAQVFFHAGALLPTGAPIRNRPLAATLRAIAKRGPDAFYRGRIAKAIATSVRAAGGIVTEADLAGYRTREAAPIRGTYRGHSVASAPLPSSGGLVLIEALAVLERFDLRAHGPGSADHLHLVAEALKPGFADRAEFLGDTPVGRAAMVLLLAPSRLQARASRVRADRALPASRWAEPREGPRDAGTTHLAVVDAEGNAVALSSTVNLGFGAHLTAAGTGVVLNDQMDDFAAQPGTANAFGLVQSAENAVGPGKRPLSSMSPTIVFDAAGAPVLVVGAAGGPRIISSTLQVLVGVVDFRLSAAEALALPRVHHQWMPDVLEMEPAVTNDACRALSALGHRIVRRERIGTAQAVARSPAGYAGAMDLRR